MSIYSERKLLSEGQDVDCTLTSEGIAESDEGAAMVLQLHCLNLPRVKQTLVWFRSYGLMETESLASELPHIPFSMHQVRANPELVFLLRNT